MTDVRRPHTRGIRRCICGVRHTREQYLYLRDQHARVVHPGGPAGAKLTGWKSYKSSADPRAPYLSSYRIDELQRKARMHSPSLLDPSTCIAPLCTNPQPCIHRLVAVRELAAAGVEVWA